MFTTLHYNKGQYHLRPEMQRWLNSHNLWVAHDILDCELLINQYKWQDRGFGNFVFVLPDEHIGLLFSLTFPPVRIEHGQH